jgi:hypothetical protein
MGITSVSFPPLGCGNGNLDWKEVKPLMEEYLSNLSIPVYIHNLHVGPEFVAEQNVSTTLPETFDSFLQDIGVALLELKGVFVSPLNSGLFSARLLPGGSLVIFSGDHTVRQFSVEDLQHIWLVLREGGVLSSDMYQAELAPDFESFVFPILENLPYMQQTWLSRFGEISSAKSRALFLAKELGGRKVAMSGESAQACLPL